MIGSMNPIGLDALLLKVIYDELRSNNSLTPKIFELLVPTYTKILSSLHTKLSHTLITIARANYKVTLLLANYVITNSRKIIDFLVLLSELETDPKTNIYPASQDPVKNDKLLLIHNSIS